MATRKATVVVLAALAASTLVLTGCTAGNTDDDGEVKGDITFLTNRTDLEEDGTYDRYIQEFQETYPDVNVKVEAITAYEDDVRPRMSTPNGYGDVLLTPDAIGVDQQPDFFEPLGSVDELSEEYRFVA